MKIILNAMGLSSYHPDMTDFLDDLDLVKFLKDNKIVYTLSLNDEEDAVYEFSESSFYMALAKNTLEAEMAQVVETYRNFSDFEIPFFCNSGFICEGGEVGTLQTDLGDILGEETSLSPEYEDLLKIIGGETCTGDAAELLFVERFSGKPQALRLELAEHVLALYRMVLETK